MMKRLRIGKPGQEKHAIRVQDSPLRDLSQHVPDVAGDFLLDEGLGAISGPESRTQTISTPITAGM